MADARLARLANGFHAADLPKLVLMTDDERLPDPRASAMGLPRGSLVVVRARQKRRRLELAIAVGGIARKRGLFLSIADDPELAEHAGADGVHFPEARAAAISHWRAKRPGWLFTASAHSLRALAHAGQLGADAVFLSPVFSTKSHPDSAVLSPIRLRLMAELVRVPIYALGGIDGGNAGRLKGARLAGIAAVGALANQT